MRIPSLSLTASLCFAFVTACTQPASEVASGSEVAFTIPESNLIPEGIAYDSVTATFFVSSTYRRKIVSIDSAGTIRDFTEAEQDGLWGNVGMQVDASRRHLWVASSHAGTGMPMQDMDMSEEGRSGVFQYDLATGTLLNRYILGSPTEPHFFNDLVVTAQGDVLVTDSRANALYRIAHESDSLDVFLELEQSPNGITLSDDEAFAFVAIGEDVGRIRLQDRAFTWLTHPAELSVDADGLYFYQGSLISVEPYDSLGVVNEYTLNADYDAIEAHTVVEAHHPAFAQPTTGVVVGDWLYYIANSQLQHFKRLYEEHGEAYPIEQLADPVILRVRLD